MTVGLPVAAFSGPVPHEAPLSKAQSSVPSLGARQIPIGLSDVRNQVMNSRRRVYAIRFVLDYDTRISRFFSGFKLEGARTVGGREGYAAGNGGRIWARLVAVRRDGRPDLRRVLAQETVGAVRRFREAGRRFEPGGRTQLLYFNTRGVRLKAGRMYAMTYQNVSRSPSRHWFSTNSPTIKASEAGPNGRNTTNPRAQEAVAGLDPREAVAWSTSGGRRWVWGRRVGEGRTRGAYPGSSTGDDGARLPWYGWQSGARGRRESNQPYYAYGASGNYTLVAPAAPRAVTLTQAGGYAPSGQTVGVITVRNIRTGEVGTTAQLGSGISRGALEPPVPLAAGDGYTISNTGTVFKAEGDGFIRRTLGIGLLEGRFSFVTVGHQSDRAELFALPHPFYP